MVEGADRFDPVSKTFSALKQLPMPLSTHQVGVVNGAICTVGYETFEYLS
jgi:hypothetical protein